MNIIGINSFFEHPSVALISNSNLVFAIEEERLTGIKHGKRYTPYKSYVPFDSIFTALRYQGLTIADIDEIAYSYNSITHLLSLFGCLTGQRISSLQEELAAFNSCRNIKSALQSDFEIPLKYQHILSPQKLKNVSYREWDHHLCHAASTFFSSGFDNALVVVADGSGEHDSTSVFVGKGKVLKRIANFPIPHSLGLFYSFITKHLGFEPFSDEFKVMALASYGQPRFKEAMNIILHPDNQRGYRVDVKALTNLVPLLGTARMPGTSLTDIHYDIASSAQKHLEMILESVIQHYASITKSRKLCLAGGTFLNCVANGVIASRGWFDDIFVHPASHDAGTAIGAATLSSIARGGDYRIKYDSMALGTSYTDEQVESILRHAKISYRRLDTLDLVQYLANVLAEGKICGLFRDRMEFGPRALGKRSLLASPTDKNMLKRINDLKGREQFRPLAPIVTEEAFPVFFDGWQNRYMLFTVQVRNEAKERIPAVTHVDGSSRVQVVKASDDKFLHDLLNCFAARTNIPVLINTSLNVRGKPIVEDPTEAISLFYTSGLDVMVIGNYLIEREQ